MEGRYIAGAALLLVGVGIALDVAGQWDFDSVARTWWPLILIAVAVVQLATKTYHPIGTTLLLGAGLFFLLDNTNTIPDLWSRYLFPLGLVLVGVMLLVPRARPTRPKTTTSDRLQRTAILGGFEDRVSAKPFRGASLSAFMGGGKFDLRESELPPEGAELRVSVFMGGLEILVPTTWPIEVSATPILGGVDNKTSREAVPSGAPVLRVRASAFMGGIEIKN